MLKEVTLQDMVHGQVSKDRILWLKIISSPFKMAGVTLIVEDKNQ